MIVGGGSAGLATAALLRERGLDPLVLEAGPEPGAAWRERYDRLRLHTPRLLSGLARPAHPAPLRPLGRARRPDRVLPPLRRAARRSRCARATRVTRIERDGTAWRVETAQGPIRAEHVIVATGYNGAPFIPDWPGRDELHGRADPLVAST